jgi:hypothetical protein
MKESTDNHLTTDDKTDAAWPVQRRSFLKLLSGSVLGAAWVAVGIGSIKRAEANKFEPLWNSAQIFIGNSPIEQSPSPIIECPLFFDNGHFANASHILDLSNLQTTGEVRSPITYNNDTIEPDLSASIAVAVTQGSDGFPYLVVAGEGEVTGGTGYFKSVNKAIIRCKYKVADDSANLLLIACINCVVILVRN